MAGGALARGRVCSGRLGSSLAATVAVGRGVSGGSREATVRADVAKLAAPPTGQKEPQSQGWASPWESCEP